MSKTKPILIAVLFMTSVLIRTTNATQFDENYSNFIERHTYNFVDKSHLLVSFFNHTSEPYNFITCPPQFGKTTMLNMIKSFAEIEIDDSGIPIPWRETRAYEIFSKLNIASYPEIVTSHLAQHPVILVNLYFDTVEFKVDKRYTSRIMTQLKHTFKQYKNIWNKTTENIPFAGSNLTEDNIVYLRNGIDGNLTKDEIQNSLYRLSEILYYYFNHTRVILLVDGYDTAATLAMNTAGRYVLKCYEFLHEMLARALEKGSIYVEYALVAASTSVSYYSVDHSRANVLRHRPFLDDHPFTSFCGLLEEESASLFNKHYCDPREKLEIKKYYNGYTSLQGVTIYDPNSLEYYFDSKFRQTLSYWLAGDRAELVYDFLHFNDVYETLSLALLGDHSFESDFVISKKYDNDALYVFMQLRNSNYTRVYLDKAKCVRQMLTFIFEQGYLSHIPRSQYGYRSPNHQTRQEILNIFNNFTEKEGSPLEFIV